MDIRAFQQLIADRYQQRDSERGTPKTFMWFVEEVGELATALADEKATLKEKEEEFADIVAWLCTLANINGIDLEKACVEKYKINQPKGFK